MARRYISVLLTVLLLCGCNRAEPPVDIGEKETVVLDIWCEREDWDIVTELCGNFAEEHRGKNYAFSLDVPPEDISAALSGNEEVDVLCFSSDITEQLVSEGLLLPVDDKSQRVDMSVSAASCNGTQYGFPYAADTCVLYYDRSKFTEHEVSDMNRMMSKRLEDTQYSMAMPLYDGIYQCAFFLAAGCDIPEECCSEQGVLAGEYMAALTDSGRFAAELSSGDIKAGFVDGSVAAAISDIQNGDAIKSTLGSYCGIAKLPQITLSDGRSVQLGSFAVYSLTGVSSRTDNAADALLLAEWLAGAEAQRMRLSELNIAPVLTELCNDNSFLKDYPDVMALLEQLEYSAPLLPYDQMEMLDEAAEELCDELIEGIDTHAELMDALVEFRDTCTVADNVLQ